MMDATQPSLDDVLKLTQVKAFIEDELLAALSSDSPGRKSLLLEKGMRGALESVLGLCGSELDQAIRERGIPDFDDDCFSNLDARVAAVQFPSSVAAAKRRTNAAGPGTAPMPASGGPTADSTVYIVRSTMASLKKVATKIALDIKERMAARDGQDAGGSRSAGLSGLLGGTRGGGGGAQLRKVPPRIDVYMVPRKPCKEVLAEAFSGMYKRSSKGEEDVFDKHVDMLGHRVTVNSLEIDLFPLEHDLITMDLPNVYSDCVLRSDYSCLSHVARSLMKLQAFFGEFKAVRGKGRLADMVSQNMRRMRIEATKHNSNSSTHASQVDCLYVFDRELDVLTPLLAHSTYEGLVDEVYGLGNQVFTPPLDMVEETAHSETNEKTFHHSFTAEGDLVFQHIRRAHRKSLAQDITELIMTVQKKEDERKGLQTLTEIRKFMGKVKVIKEAKHLLGLHIAIAKEIKSVCTTADYLNMFDHQHRCIGVEEDPVTYELSMKYIDTCIFQNQPLTKVLRLLCVECLTDGLSRKTYDEYRQKIVQAYGLSSLSVMDNLEKAGLCGVNKRSPAFAAQRGKGGLRNAAEMVGQLQFWKDRSGEQPKNAAGGSSEADLAALYDGYKPPIVRLVEAIMLGTMQWYVQKQNRITYINNNNTICRENDVTVTTTATATTQELGGRASEPASRTLVWSPRPAA